MLLINIFFLTAEIKYACHQTFTGSLKNILDFVAAFHTPLGLCENASDLRVELLLASILNEQ